jgi:hypothetical protein
VIEGLVTNRAGAQFVKVSRSTEFYGSGLTPRVENANVQVSDNLGAVIAFVHNPGNDPDSVGFYVPEANFAGQVGRTYSLRVEVDGEVYEAADELRSVIPIDSLAFQENENEAKDPKDFGKTIEILMFAREPQDQKNFYMFKFYRNDSLTFYSPTDIYFSDDELLAESINGVPSPIYYAPEDKARMEIYSLSREGYVFFNDLSVILNNDGGGMFGSIPSSPRTNLTNGALGFFQVSAVGDKEIMIR